MGDMADMIIESGLITETMEEGETAYQEMLAEMICPICSNPLVFRYGKYGKFIGCLSFPKCEFTANCR